MYEEIINAINGRTDEGLPKCAVSIDKYVYDISAKEPVLVSSRRLTDVCISLGKIPSFDRCCIQLDFTFPNAGNYEMSALWEILQEYGTQLANITGESKEVPQIYFTIIPLQFECKYYVLCSLPLFWGLAVENIGDEAKTIRLVFDAENVQIYETNSIDYEKIVSIVNQEVLDEERENEERIAAKEAEEAERRQRMYNNYENENNNTNFGEPENKKATADSRPEEERRFRVVE